MAMVHTFNSTGDSLASRIIKPEVIISHCLGLNDLGKALYMFKMVCAVKLLLDQTNCD
jgi:hypothetical protein